MKQTLRICLVVMIVSYSSQTHPMHASIRWYTQQAKHYLTQTLIAAAAIGTAGALTYYCLLPAATQTATAVGTALVKETVRVGELATEKTAPYGAAGFLVHYIMNEFGIRTQQATSRVAAVMATLFLLKIQLQNNLGF